MKLRLIPVLSITSIVILFVAMSARQRTDAQQPPVPLPLPESTADPLPVDREKYSPARYSIPETLAGFEVLAVVTHEHNPCSPEDFIQVYLQGVESSLEEYRQGNTPANVGKAFDELRLIYPNAVISIGHKVEDLNAFFLELDTSNWQRQQSAATYGCQPLGGPSIVVTPSETD